MIMVEVSSQLTEKNISRTAAEMAMYSASTVDIATVLCNLLPHATGAPHIIAMNPVLERLLSPSPNEESCNMMGSRDVSIEGKTK